MGSSTQNLDYEREDPLNLSELDGVFGTYINWWVRCKGTKAWTIAIQKLKQTNNTCRRGSFRLQCVKCDVPSV
jgi:hypothetical protein